MAGKRTFDFLIHFNFAGGIPGEQRGIQAGQNFIQRHRDHLHVQLRAGGGKQTGHHLAKFAKSYFDGAKGELRDNRFYRQRNGGSWRRHRH